MTDHPHRSDEPPTSVPSRRTFLERAWQWTTAAVGAIAAAVLAVPVVGYFLGVLSRKQDEWVKLGPVSAFPEGETRHVTFTNPIRQPWDGPIAQTAAFVRYNGLDDDKKPHFLILAVNCAHLGCAVSWFAQSGLFMCPCHGGVYYSSGARASGPPPQGLYQYDWKVRDGELYVQAPHYPTLQDPLRKKGG